MYSYLHMREKKFRQTWPLQYRLKAFPYRSILPSSGPMHKYHQPLFVYIRNSSKRLALNAQGPTWWIPNPRRGRKGTINFTFRPTLPPEKETPGSQRTNTERASNPIRRRCDEQTVPDTKIEHYSSSTVRNARSKETAGMHSPLATHSRQLCCITQQLRVLYTNMHIYSLNITLPTNALIVCHLF